MLTRIIGRKSNGSKATNHLPVKSHRKVVLLEVDDLHLVRRFQQGDLSAFEQLVESYKQRVVNYAARTIGDPTEAQDIAQKAFVQVFSALGRFRLQANFSTWLFAITRNLCLNELRRRTRHRTEPLEHDHDGEQRRRSTRTELTCCSTAQESLLQSELVEKLDEALAALPERQRTAILLLRESKISNENIAAVLGTTIPATKSLIHNGRKRLKRILCPYIRSGAGQISSRRCPTPVQ